MTTEATENHEAARRDGSRLSEGLGPSAEALKRERARLRSLSYKTDAITARLETIHRELERMAWKQ